MRNRHLLPGLERVLVGTPTRPFADGTRVLAGRAQTRWGAWWARAPAAPALFRAARDRVDDGLHRVARRLEPAGREPGALGDAARRRGLRAVGSRDAHLVLLAHAAVHPAARDRRPRGRRLHLHLRRARRPSCGRRSRAAPRSPTRTRPTCSTTDGGPRSPRSRRDWDAEYLTRARQRAREGRQHQQRAADHRRRPRVHARRRPRAAAGRARRADRLLRRRARRGRADAARVLQPRLDPALRDRPPRAVGLLLGDLPRQGSPQRRLLVRLGRRAAALGAARCRRRGGRDDRRGLPHDDQAAPRRLDDALPRRGRRAGPRAARPRRLPAAARPLGARQPRGLHDARVAAARARAEADPAPELLREPLGLPRRPDAAADARDARGRHLDGTAPAHRDAAHARPAVGAGDRCSRSSRARRSAAATSASPTRPTSSSAPLRSSRARCAASSVPGARRSRSRPRRASTSAASNRSASSPGSCGIALILAAGLVVRILDEAGVPLVRNLPGGVAFWVVPALGALRAPPRRPHARARGAPPPAPHRVPHAARHAGRHDGPRRPLGHRWARDICPSGLGLELATALRRAPR